MVRDVAIREIGEPHIGRTLQVAKQQGVTELMKEQGNKNPT